MLGSSESVQRNACVNRLHLGLYYHPKKFGGNGVYDNSEGKNPSSGQIFPTGGSNPRRCIKQDSEPSTLPTIMGRHGSDYSLPSFDLRVTTSSEFLWTPMCR